MMNMLKSSRRQMWSTIFATRGCAFSGIRHLQGEPVYTDNTRDVNLRGTYLPGKTSDLPTMIFFTETCDLTNSWIPFFTNPQYDILSHRNVWLLNPRNFGNSDRHPSFDLSEQADDVIRFMYTQKLSMATLAGHGLGAKLALATGCYHSERVTGVFAIDSSPMDQRYHESFVELKNNVQALTEVDLRTWNEKDVAQFLKTRIKDPKWRSIFQ